MLPVQKQPYVVPYDARYEFNPSYPQNGGRYAYQFIQTKNQSVIIHKQKYVFDRKIAAGRSSTVYAARRRSDNQPVAIKMLSLTAAHTSEAMLIMQSFTNEIKMIRRLTGSSSHIIHMYDFDFQRPTGLCFIVMELGQQDLEKYLSQRSALSSAERKSIWRQLVNIANTLHTYQMMHLNITPDNLILFPNGLLKIADFGMAQKVHEPQSVSYGTPPYSAPELTMVARHRMATVTTKADIWSLGAVLYRMTYMVPPDNIEPCYRPPRSQRPAKDQYLLSVLHSTLRTDPSERADVSWLAKHPYTTTA